ncbi:hypothetical protein [Pseudomonas kurunegalensis]|uniref:hypothetical protein n=1 Tax=Pseudomonas kurunegalensis TaxID=485880 RepID=UPI0032618687
MAARAEFACQWCKQPFTARLADRKRGWARFCSKSCKAKEQEKRTGHNAAFHDRRREAGGDLSDEDDAFTGWDEGGWLSDDSGCSPIR